MAIITVSRQLGSLGDEIAQNVASDLGYEYVNKTKIGEALAIQGVPHIEIEKYDEKKPSIWDSFIIQRSKFLHLIRAVIYDFAGKNNTVILGRGGQVLLKNLPGALHVRIIAPLGVRLKRIMEREGYDERNGERILKRSDRESSGYIRSLFGADWNDQNLYDMIINTKAISIDSVVEMIKNTIDSSEFKKGFTETLDKLSDLALQQKAETIIMEMRGIDRVFVANVVKGVVTLVGSTDSLKVKEDCEREISKLKGVERIKNDILIVKPISYV